MAHDIAIDEWDDADHDLRKHNRVRRQRARLDERPRFALDLTSAEPRQRPAVRRARSGRDQEFRCRHCHTFVGVVPTGGRHRNHCPVCLYSRHVDERVPGDRLSACGGSMAPIGMFVRSSGEHAVVHRCLSCGIERHNRIAADDDFALVLRLTDMTQHLRYVARLQGSSAAESGTPA